MEDVHYCTIPPWSASTPAFPMRSASCRAAGFRTLIVTNQSGIGRGLFTEAQYRAVHDEFLRQLGPGPSTLPISAPTRPASLHAPQARSRHGAGGRCGICPDLPNSFLIGDKAADIECGRRAGTQTILVLTGYGAEQICRADFTARDVLEAVEIVTRRGLTY